jgi:uncharacterized protein YbjT (DUF2867 family)
MKIVVTTPTGKVGSRVVHVLVQAGVRPTLLLRDPSKLDRELAPLVDAVAGDQLVAADVLRATEGADALYLVCPPSFEGDPVEHYARAGAIAARAVEEHTIPRVVFQSSGGAEKRSGVGEIDGLARTEVDLDATGASVTHLRCGYFFTNLLIGLQGDTLPVTMPVDMKLPWVDPRDIGDVAAARLLSTDWTGRHVLAVHGPQDLTFAEAAAIVAEATGRSVHAEQIPDEAMRSALRSAGLGEPVIEGILGMSIGLREDFVPEQERTLLTTTPTTLRAWAYEHLRG